LAILVQEARLLLNFKEVEAVVAAIPLLLVNTPVPSRPAGESVERAGCKGIVASHATIVKVAANRYAP
jgi:hypothetical protein